MGASAAAAQADNPSCCCPTGARSRSADPEDIRAVPSRQLAAFKRPKAIRLVDELPRNAMGKVQKALLRTEYSRFFSKS